MYRKFFSLFKKELLTIIRDRKSFVSFIIMSLVLTPALVGGIGVLQKFQQDQLAKEEAIIAITNQENRADLVEFIKNNSEIKIVESQDVQRDLESKNIKGYLELNQVKSQLVATFIYDQSSNSSVATAVKVGSIVQQYAIIARQDILTQKNITEVELNPVTYQQITLQEVQNKPSQNDFVLIFLPYIILIGLIQGAAQFAIELTAGEKERNTLATTLSLNASRATIGLAKISAILILSLVSLVLNLTSLILTFTLLPTTFSSASNPESMPFELSITPVMLLQIFFVLLPLSFLLSSLLVLIGTYARNQKEGGLYILPLIMGSIFIGLTGQAFDANTPAYIFAIPLIGQVALIKQILLGQFIALNFLISVAGTILLFSLILTVSINMFKREEVIFRQ